MNLRPTIIFVRTNDRLTWEARYLCRDGSHDPCLYSTCKYVLTALAGLGLNISHEDRADGMSVIQIKFNDEADECEFIIKMSDRSDYSEDDNDYND